MPVPSIAGHLRWTNRGLLGGNIMAKRTRVALLDGGEMYSKEYLVFWNVPSEASIMPGHIALTRMPALAVSKAALFVAPMTPCFAAL